MLPRLKQKSILNKIDTYMSLDGKAASIKLPCRKESRAPIKLSRRNDNFESSVTMGLSKPTNNRQTNKQTLTPTISGRCSGSDVKQLKKKTSRTPFSEETKSEIFETAFKT